MPNDPWDDGDQCCCTDPAFTKAALTEQQQCRLDRLVDCPRCTTPKKKRGIVAAIRSWF
ncbi:hypothetical protein ACFWPU_00870 [Streptomyces sp. NPDC058471]|uniref:hypothetical protein n=1 Tax=Streptomyces sp. NPDC058471 TaxID=3346516 RepID=UPI00365F822A